MQNKNHVVSIYVVDFVNKKLLRTRHIEEGDKNNNLYIKNLMVWINELKDQLQKKSA